jgi:hypothetical protein
MGFGDQACKVIANLIQNNDNFSVLVNYLFYCLYFVEFKKEFYY